MGLIQVQNGLRLLVMAAAFALLVPAGMEAAASENLQIAQATGGTGYNPMLRPSRPSTDPDRPQGNPDLGDLPDAPGAEDTFYLCSACHSIALVKQQRLTDERWNYVWDWMIAEQGMPEQDEATRETILTYLKTYFSSER